MRKIAHQVSRGPSTTRSGRQFALFYEGKHAGESVFDRAGTDFINVAAEADWVGYVAPDRCIGLFKFAEQKGIYGAIREEHLNRLQVRACHGKDVCRTIDKRGSERLAAKTADVHAFLFADLHGVETGRLAAHRVYASRGNFDIFSVPKHLAKNPFRDGTAANVTCADKKDAFHDSDGANGRDSNLGSNVPESISPNVGAPFSATILWRDAVVIRHPPKDQSKGILSSGQLQPEFVPKIQNQNSAKYGND